MSDGATTPVADGGQPLASGQERSPVIKREEKSERRTTGHIPPGVFTSASKAEWGNAQRFPGPDAYPLLLHGAVTLTGSTIYRLSMLLGMGEAGSLYRVVAGRNRLASLYSARLWHLCLLSARGVSVAEMKRVDWHSGAVEWSDGTFTNGEIDGQPYVEENLVGSRPGSARWAPREAVTKAPEQRSYPKAIAKLTRAGLEPIERLE